MMLETINERILKISEAIEAAQDDDELGRLDNEFEELELLRIEMEMKENE